MSEITWSRFADIDNRTLYSLLRLRSEVFVVEQECAFLDLDGHDTVASTEHAWIVDTPENSDDVVAGLLQKPVGSVAVVHVIDQKVLLPQQADEPKGKLGVVFEQEQFHGANGPSILGRSHSR